MPARGGIRGMRTPCPSFVPGRVDFPIVVEYIKGIEGIAVGISRGLGGFSGGGCLRFGFCQAFVALGQN